MNINEWAIRSNKYVHNALMYRLTLLTPNTIQFKGKERWTNL